MRCCVQARQQLHLRACCVPQWKNIHRLDHGSSVAAENAAAVGRLDELGEEQGHRRLGRAHPFIALQSVRIERIFCTQQRTSRPAHEDSIHVYNIGIGYCSQTWQEGFLEARRHAHQHRLSECRFQVLQP